MRGLLQVAALCLSAVASQAMWVKMTMQELVTASDLIVVGDLVELTPSIGPGPVIGKIGVRSVLLGPKDTKEVSVVARPTSGPLIRSDMIFYREGQTGVWFLRTKPESKPALFLADHPQRLQAESKAAEVQSYLESRAKR